MKTYSCRPPRQAVCVVCFSKHDNAVLNSNSGVNGSRVISISRRNSTTEFGLPGGKVDPGETTIEAAVREYYEELRINLKIESLVPIYSGMCSGDVDFWVTTYFCLDYVDPDMCVPEEGMVMRELNAHELVLPSVSPFAAYNAQVFKALSSFRGNYF